MSNSILPPGVKAPGKEDRGLPAWSWVLIVAGGAFALALGLIFLLAFGPVLQ